MSIYIHVYIHEANLCKIESSIHTTTSHYEFLNVNILQIKGFDKTCFCKHMDKIYEIGVLSIYWKTFSIHCSLRKTIIALRRVLISKMCILSIICQSAMILYIQCWALIFNLLKSIVIVFFPMKQFVVFSIHLSLWSLNISHIYQLYQKISNTNQHLIYPP